jgi:hypothetical protein
MAICSPLDILSSHKEFDKECEILPSFKNNEVAIPIKQVIALNGEQHLCLLVLEKPYWKAGWAGVSFVKEDEKFHFLDMRIVYHPDKVINKDNENLFHQQIVRKFRVPKMTKLSRGFTIPNKGHIGAIVCKVVDKKPYVIGVQISESEVMFVSEATFSKIRSEAKKYIKSQQNEK